MNADKIQTFGVWFLQSFIFLSLIFILKVFICVYLRSSAAKNALTCGADLFLAVFPTQAFQCDLAQVVINHAFQPAPDIAQAAGA